MGLPRAAAAAAVEAAEEATGTHAQVDAARARESGWRHGRHERRGRAGERKVSSPPPARAIVIRRNRPLVAHAPQPRKRGRIRKNPFFGRARRENNAWKLRRAVDATDAATSLRENPDERPSILHVQSIPFEIVSFVIFVSTNPTKRTPSSRIARLRIIVVPPLRRCYTQRRNKTILSYLLYNDRYGIVQLWFVMIPARFEIKISHTQRYLLRS